MGVFTAFPKATSSSTHPPNIATGMQYIEANYEVVFALETEAKEVEVRLKKGINNTCSCVAYARWKSGINIPMIGMAKNLQINQLGPSVGAIVQTNESKYGHLAVVVGIEGDTLTISESNYKPCQQGTRTLKIDDPRIRGYYK